MISWFLRHPELALVTMIGSLASILVCTILIVRVTGSAADRIAYGTTVGGVEVGGLGREEAERLVASRIPAPRGRIEIIIPGRRRPMVLPVARVRPTPSIREAIDRAVEPPSIAYRIRRELGLGGRRHFPVTFRLRAGSVDVVLTEVSRVVERPARSARVTIVGGSVKVAPAQAGLAADRPALRALLESLRRRVPVPLTAIPPLIADGEAAAAAHRARRIVRGPVTVTDGRRAVVVRRSALARALRVERDGSRLKVRLAPEAIRRAVAEPFRVLVRPARSARFRIRGRGVEVIPAAPGRAIDATATARAIERGAPAPVRVRIRPVAPILGTVAARRLRIREPVGEFTTRFPCCQPRVVNITKAARILDGLIVPPGGLLSLNEALGERTAGRGFVPAPQIFAGRLENAVGGGVSQVATTLFNAAFFAGLRIVSHRPHDFWISRYPPGREATVSWGGPELVVQNDWPAGLLVDVQVTAESIRIRLFSSRLGRRVTTSTRGTPVEGAAFAVAYTRRVLVRERVRRDERFAWSYRPAPS